MGGSIKMSRLKNLKIVLIVWCLVFVLTGIAFSAKEVEITGELKKWHKVTLTFEGPEISEDADTNPFLDYNLIVEFSNGNNKYEVPGYFAADGDAADTGATKGNQWKVHFCPDQAGKWEYSARLYEGQRAAIIPSSKINQVYTGSFEIEDTDKTGRDFRAKGWLEYVGKRYLQFAETKDFFLKGGADSPENFLAYYEFDGTYDMDGLNREGEAKGGTFIHRYEPHVKDFKEGDPTWQDGKGKNIIGALNYLASKGMNSVYFLTMNVEGDGKDVWPWTNPNERFRFDCSKLDQWEIVFEHMDKLGLMMHVITQETENDHLLDGGELGPERKLYYRELIARFSHHPCLVWNLGEENTNTPGQLKAFATYIRDLDPYDHPIVVHSYPDVHWKYRVYKPLIGFEHFEGPSVQLHYDECHQNVKSLIAKSAKAGHPWFVCTDESGSARQGMDPDDRKNSKDDPLGPNNQGRLRQNVLWGNLMAGGAGVEWYFGYQNPHNDLNCEDWRSRDRAWDFTHYALDFFHKYLPFTEMESADELVEASWFPAWCFAKPGRVYAVYLPQGGSAILEISAGNYSVKWYNPRSGGDLQDGVVKQVTGPGEVSLGNPPRETKKDWAILVRKNN